VVEGEASAAADALMESAARAKNKGHPESSVEQFTAPSHQSIDKSELTVDFRAHNMPLKNGIQC